MSGPTRALGVLGSGFLLWGVVQAATGAPALLTLAGGCLLLGAAVGRGPWAASQDSTIPRPRWAATPADPVAPIAIPLPQTTLLLYPTDGDTALVARLYALVPADFEHFCCRLLTAQGYQQVQVTGRVGDGGVDLLAWHASMLVLAQCKRTLRAVGAQTLRDFYGALVAAEARYGIVLTTGHFTEAARRWAADKPLELLDGSLLAASVRTHLLEGHVFHRENA